MTTTNSGLAVAHTILEQLGGSRFRAMTGARDLAGDAASLTFKLPARLAKDGINCVKVSLADSDTYTATFYKIGRAPRFSVDVVSESSGVDASALREVFTRATGLDCTLGTCGR